MRNLCKYCMLICNITSTVLILGFASPGLAQWQYSVVDTLQSDLENLSIDLGPGGIPHILYYDSQGAIVKHARLSDTGWTRDTVGFNNNYYGFCVDGLDQVHVVFTAPTYRRLVHWVHTPDSDYADTIIVQPRIVGADLEVDAENRAHVSATTLTPIPSLFYLLYCAEGEAGWQVDTVAGLHGAQGKTDLEIASDGSIGIVSSNPDDWGNITYCTNRTGGWSCDTAYEYEHGVVNGSISAGYDSMDNCHLTAREVHPQTGWGRLVYCHQEGGQWYSEHALDSVYNLWWDSYAPLAISSDDVVSVAFRAVDSTPQGCYYAYLNPDANQWIYYQINAGYTDLLDMVMDDNDGIHICYISADDENNFYLMYAFGQSPLSVIESQGTRKSSGAVVSIFPNPANQSFVITVSCRRDHYPVNIDVYDLSGRRVYGLKSLMLKAGDNSILLQANSFIQGEPASGVYLLKVKGDAIDISTKMTLLK